MKDNYKIDIVSPEKLIFSDENITEAVLPSYEGEIGILKDHMPIIAFLKPGIIRISKISDKTKSFFVEDGVIEFYNNSLTILSSRIVDTNELNKEKINKLISETEKNMKDKKLDDNEKYLADNKIDTLKLLSLN